MPTVDNYSSALLNGMDSELKVKLARIAERQNKTVDALLVEFLSEGVNTYPGFIASFAR